MNRFTQTIPQHNPERNRKLALLAVEKGMSEDEAVKLIDEEFKRNQNMWQNDTYNVIIQDADVDKDSGFPEMIWLSIKRLDKEPIHDWRELQEIKNQLVGEENEAMEIYPAESRLVDSTNQFHLWVIKDNTIRFPFGFSARAVLTSQEAEFIGGKQRERRPNFTGIVGAHIGHGHSVAIAHEIIKRTGVIHTMPDTTLPLAMLEEAARKAGKADKGSVIIVGSIGDGKTVSNEMRQKISKQFGNDVTIVSADEAKNIGLGTNTLAASSFSREPMKITAVEPVSSSGVPKSGQESRRERRKNKR